MEISSGPGTPTQNGAPLDSYGATPESSKICTNVFSSEEDHGMLPWERDTRPRGVTEVTGSIDFKPCDLLGAFDLVASPSSWGSGDFGEMCRDVCRDTYQQVYDEMVDEWMAENWWTEWTSGD